MQLRSWRRRMVKCVFYIVVLLAWGVDIAVSCVLPWWVLVWSIAARHGTPASWRNSRGHWAYCSGRWSGLLGKWVQGSTWRMVISGPWVGCHFTKGWNILGRCMSSRSKSRLPLLTFPVISGWFPVCTLMVYVSAIWITLSLVAPSRQNLLLEALFFFGIPYLLSWSHPSLCVSLERDWYPI